jgi:hypothetical protein
MLENPYRPPVPFTEKENATVEPRSPLQIFGSAKNRPAGYRRGGEIGGLLGFLSGLATDAWIFWLAWTTSYDRNWGRLLADLEDWWIICFLVALVPTLAGAGAGAIGFAIVSRCTQGKKAVTGKHVAEPNRAPEPQSGI